MGCGFVRFEFGENVEYIEDLTGKLFEREGEVSHARRRYFFLIYILLVERDMMRVEIFKGFDARSVEQIQRSDDSFGEKWTYGDFEIWCF